MCELVECCNEIVASISAPTPIAVVAPNTPSPDMGGGEKTPGNGATDKTDATKDTTTPVDAEGEGGKADMMVMVVGAAFALLVFAVIAYYCSRRMKTKAILKDVEMTRQSPVII
jgi:hypothetical protein